MSVRHLPLCRMHHGIGAPAKAVLYVLADHADDQGVTWIGEQTLLDESETSRSALYRSLAALRKLGLIARERHGGREVWRVTDPAACPNVGLVADESSPNVGL